MGKGQKMAYGMYYHMDMNILFYEHEKHTELDVFAFNSSDLHQVTTRYLLLRFYINMSSSFSSKL